jgi:hypothetical protein
MVETGAISASKIIMTIDYDNYFLNLKLRQLSGKLMWNA